MKKLFGSTSAAKKALNRMEDRATFTIDNLVQTFLSVDTDVAADIFLGSMDDVPVKFYDAELGTL